MATTVNTFVTAVENFFTNAWPALVGLMILIILALVVLRFGRGILGMIRVGRR